jgi:hypothetical protein
MVILSTRSHLSVWDIYWKKEKETLWGGKWVTPITSQGCDDFANLMSLLPQWLQNLEWMPFSVLQCLQIFILLKEITLIKWKTI